LTRFGDLVSSSSDERRSITSLLEGAIIVTKTKCKNACGRVV
jgi:hypothetical protein